MTKAEKDSYRKSYYWKKKMLRIYGRLLMKNIIRAFRVEKLFKTK